MTGYVAVDPYTGKTLATVPFITDDQLEAALSAVDHTWQGWSAESTVAERATLLSKVADLHEERLDRLADIIVSEMGKPRAQAVGEVEFSASIYRYYAENAESFLADEPIDVEEGEAFIRKSPLGPLLGIMPWNFPLYQVARFAGPNLVVGNPILLKHAPQCPESAEALQQIFWDAGFPQGAYVNIFASVEQISSIIPDSRIRGVSLTGSERAGAAVAELAGRHLKKVVLELGGSDPFIVLSDEGLEATVEAAVAARLDNNGQSCNAAKRFIVLDHVFDAFAEKFTAALREVTPQDPTSEETVLGPLSSEQAAARLEEQVERAIAHGAKALLAPQPRKGTLFSPVVLSEVSVDNPAYREEFFGPVAQLHRAKDEAEAIKIANGTPFGLGSYIFTPDVAQARRVGDRLETGMVFINAVGAESAELPFGGVKNSGTGRELGSIGIEEFVNKKMFRLPAGA